MPKLKTALISIGYEYPHLRPHLRAILSSIGAGRDIQRGDFKDNIQYQFAQYALNEQPLSLSPEDIEQATQTYGGLYGVQGGLIYRGGRINSLEALEDLKNLQSGGRWRVNLKSFSHDKAQAREFADFIKTFDSSVGMIQMQRALDRGSAGVYGSYVITAKADPSTIVINTQNPNMPVSVEDELIVNGDVEVVSVELIEPLTKDNWTEQTFKGWSSLEMLRATDFLTAWLSEQNINSWRHGLGDWLMAQTRSYPALKEFLTTYSRAPLSKYMRKFEAYSNFISRHPQRSKLIEEAVVTEDTQGGTPRIFLDGIRVYVGPDLNREIMKTKGSSQWMRELQEASRDLEELTSRINVSGNRLSVRVNKYSSNAVRNFIYVVLHLISLDLYDPSMIESLRDFLHLVRKASQVSMTDDNWKEHFALLRMLHSLSQSFDRKSLRRFDQDSGLTDKGLTNSLKVFGKQMYVKMNSRDINTFKSLPVLMQELPQMMALTVQLL